MKRALHSLLEVNAEPQIKVSVHSGMLVYDGVKGKKSPDRDKECHLDYAGTLVAVEAQTISSAMSFTLET